MKRDMRIILGGVRGSMPLSDARYTSFGGATTCVLVDNGENGRLLFDAGTGLRTLQPLLAAADEQQPVLMLFTHYHLDHLMGLPNFAPLYDPARSFLIAAPPCDGVTAEQAVRRIVAPPFWPAPFRAHLHFHTLPATCGETPFRHGPFDVRWCAVHHCNGCHAYRVDERGSGASLVFATDLEWSSSSGPERDALVRLCREPAPVDVLIMEGHHDARSLAGWGHSTWQEAVQLARTVSARQLVITHLSPEDDDLVLAEREQRLRGLMPAARLGRQGMSIAWNKGSDLPD